MENEEVWILHVCRCKRNRIHLADRYARCTVPGNGIGLVSIVLGSLRIELEAFKISKHFIWKAVLNFQGSFFIGMIHGKLENRRIG